MDSATFLAFFGIVVGVPVICWAVTDIFKRWLRHRETMAQVLSEQTAERAAQYAAKVERLENRMGVIERILTDRSTHLSEEIERLRDAPIN
jgi:hypothetical protein